MRSLIAVAMVFMATSCVSPTAVEYEDTPSLSGDSVVVGTWVENYQRYTGVFCPINLTLSAPRPVRLSGGHIRFIFAVGTQQVQADKEIGLTMIENMWGGSDFQGTRKSDLVLIPPLMYFNSYSVTIDLYWSTGRTSGVVSHTLRCVSGK